MSYHIANCSFGKDSLAMVLRLLDDHAPLDEVVFYDTGMEFRAIYNARDRLLPMLRIAGVAYTELRPANPFLVDMLERPVTSAQNGTHLGYGWCGGACRWGTAAKQAALNRYARERSATVYVGIAADETARLKKPMPGHILHPLADWGMSEADCLAYCRERGFAWDENGVDLYDILDRVSCWCCANKNRRELENMFRYLPEYWERLKGLQRQITRPMKKWRNKKYGEYGDVLRMEDVFRLENGEGG